MGKKKRLSLPQEMAIEIVEELLKEMKAHPECIAHWEVHREPNREQPNQMTHYMLVMRVLPPK